MESVSVYFNDLKPILKEIQQQRIGIKIQNHHQSLSDTFYTIEEIKDFSHREFRLTVLILYDGLNTDSTVIDLKSIRGLELEKPLMIDNTSAKAISIKKS